MDKQLDKTKLGYIGEDFQFVLTKAFMEEYDYFLNLCTIVNPNAFTNSLLRTYISTLKDYTIEHGIIPNYELMLILLNQKARTEIDQENNKEIVKKIKETSTVGIDTIKDIATKFFKQQELVKAANEILKIAGNGDFERYDECVGIAERAVTAGTADEYGVKPLDDIEDTLSEESIIHIPTGIDKLDDALTGGLVKGQVGVIIGSMGFGKTTLTTAISAAAATSLNKSNDYKGFKVLQIVFEDAPKDIRRKYISNITKVEARFLSINEDRVKEVKRLLGAYGRNEIINENIRIKRFPTGEKTAKDIVMYVKQIRNTGFTPDLVIVDYFECLVHKGEVGDDEWKKQNKSMRTFENAAAELNMGFWIPTQGGRDSITSQLVTADQMGGSIGKGQIAQVVVSITRSVEDQANNLATLAVLKARTGKAGEVFDKILFNNGTCTISCDNVTSFDDALAFREDSYDKTQKEIISSLKTKQKQDDFDGEYDF